MTARYTELRMRYKVNYKFSGTEQYLLVDSCKTSWENLTKNIVLVRSTGKFKLLLMDFKYLIPAMLARLNFHDCSSHNQESNGSSPRFDIVRNGRIVFIAFCIEIHTILRPFHQHCRRRYKNPVGDLWWSRRIRNIPTGGRMYLKAVRFSLQSGNWSQVVQQIPTRFVAASLTTDSSSKVCLTP